MIRSFSKFQETFEPKKVLDREERAKQFKIFPRPNLDLNLKDLKVNDNPERGYALFETDTVPATLEIYKFSSTRVVCKVHTELSDSGVFWWPNFEDEESTDNLPVPEVKSEIEPIDNSKVSISEEDTMKIAKSYAIVIMLDIITHVEEVFPDLEADRKKEYLDYMYDSIEPFTENVYYSLLKLLN